VVTGDVKARGRVRVHGAVHGDVEVDGLLEVAKDGVVDGASIVAEALVVLGRVRGAVRVSGKVEVWKGGVLEGDVRAGSLDIEDGATFVGRSEMSLPDGPPQLGAPSAAAGGDARRSTRVRTRPRPRARRGQRRLRRRSGRRRWVRTGEPREPSRAARVSWRVLVVASPARRTAWRLNAGSAASGRPAATTTPARLGCG
jgi:hypothetical protein